MQIKMRRVLVRVGLLTVSLGVVLGLAEGVMRMLPPPSTPGELYFRDQNGREVGTIGAQELDFTVLVEPAPRFQRTLAPGAGFFICYRDWTQPWFNEQGCVEIRFNSSGIRDQEEIGFDKPAGQRRILCLGDSFTLGWGINVEDSWVELVEPGLRETFGDVVTVNCGGAGTLFMDEYWWGLQHRFHKFQPDMVVVTVCLNDLFVTNGGLFHSSETSSTGSALADRLRSLFHDPMQLDPGVDWVERLINLPEDHPLYGGLGGGMFWGAGTPQSSLRAIRDWCRERDLPFAVVLWPFLQGLAPNEFYPFEKMHRMLGEFCAQEEIPFLDLLDTFKGQEARDLWVAPRDRHFNPLGQRLATEPISRFLAEQSGFPRIR